MVKLCLPNNLETNGGTYFSKYILSLQVYKTAIKVFKSIEMNLNIKYTKQQSKYLGKSIEMHLYIK